MSIIIGGNLIQGAFMRMGRTQYNLNDCIHYTFDNTLADSGDGLYDLQPTGTYAYGTGRFGNALSLNKTVSTDEGVIYSGHSISLNPSNGFSFACFINKRAVITTGETKTVLKIKGDYTEYEYRITQNTAPDLETHDFIFYNPNDGSRQFSMVNDLEAATGTWYHFAVTYDGTTGYKCYLDGSYNLGFTSGYTRGNEIKTIDIGGFGSDMFDGRIDDVRICNTEWSAQEVEYLYLYGTLQPSSITFTATSSTSFVVPANATSITAIAIGGGGAGGGFNSYGSDFSAGAPGGAGGAYASKTFAVTPGQTYVVSVGAGGNVTTPTGGDSSLNLSGSSSFEVLAKGGTGIGRIDWTGSLAGAVAVAATQSSGDTKYAGGNGGAGDKVAPVKDAGGGGSAGLAGSTGDNGNTIPWFWPDTESYPDSAGGTGGGYAGNGGDIGRQTGTGTPSENDGENGFNYGGAGGGGFSYVQRSATLVSNGGAGIVVYTINFTY